MNAPVLLYGQRNPASIVVSDAPLNLDASDTLVVTDAEIFYCLFEMRMQVAEQLLPASLHPSVPALLGITFIHASDSPLGAFDLAYVGVACRTGIKPRHFIQSAFCDSASGADFFRSRYGFPCQRADVSCRETYDRVRGAVGVDGQSVLDVSITDCIPLLGAGATIKYSPPLNAIKLNDAATLVQFEAAYEFKRVLRGKPRATCFDSGVLGDASLAPTYAIAGSHAVVDLHLMPVRFEVDMAVPAEAGGARKIQR